MKTYDEKDRVIFLKAATDVLKKTRRKGPQNIFVNFIDSDVQIGATIPSTLLEKTLSTRFSIIELEEIYFQNSKQLLKIFNCKLKRNFEIVSFNMNYLEEKYVLVITEK